MPLFPSATTVRPSRDQPISMPPGRCRISPVVRSRMRSKPSSSSRPSGDTAPRTCPSTCSRMRYFPLRPTTTVVASKYRVWSVSNTSAAGPGGRASTVAAHGHGRCTRRGTAAPPPPHHSGVVASAATTTTTATSAVARLARPGIPAPPATATDDKRHRPRVRRAPEPVRGDTAGDPSRPEDSSL
ncbi:hypothetical protein [Dactylosporangium darangshiense]|uniref:hypothetical protein n=1 Tax=Dactylosporangium darangshiense TaxID=579108 RepID=UPI003636E895